MEGEAVQPFQGWGPGECLVGRRALPDATFCGPFRAEAARNSNVVRTRPRG